MKIDDVQNLFQQDHSVQDKIFTNQRIIYEITKTIDKLKQFAWRVCNRKG